MKRVRKTIESEAKEDGSLFNHIIPDDVAVDIVTTLPVRNLGRVRCVSKSWLRFLSDPEFLNRHAVAVAVGTQTKNHDDADDEMKLACYLPKTKSIHAVDLERGFDDVIYSDVGNRIALRGKPNPRCELIGSDNGLICLKQTQKSSHEAYLLINPVTREFSKALYIPDRLNEPKPYHQYHQYGFGYDLSTNDYKTVRIVSYPHPTFPHPIISYKVDVFSWKNNCWRSIDDDDVLSWKNNCCSSIDDDDKEKVSPTYPYILPTQIATCLGGVLHWKCSREYRNHTFSPRFNDWCREIFTFDLGTNKCGVLKGVCKQNEHEKSIATMSVLQGCLCVVLERFVSELAPKPSKIGECFDIWKMKEYGDEESWVKVARLRFEFRFSLRFRCRPRLIFYAYDDGMLLFENGFGDVFIYCIEDDSVTPCRVPRKFKAANIVAYTESLVSPPKLVVNQNADI